MKKNIVFIFILISIFSVFSDELVNINKPVSPNESIFIENISGIVNVNGWDKNELSIKGKLSKYVERLDLTSDAENETTSVTLVLKESEREKKNVNCYLDIWVPVNSKIDVNTTSSSIKIAYLKGDITARSVSGEIECYANANNVELQTASGGLKSSGNAKNLSITTVSGRVKVIGTSDYLVVEAVSSDVDIEGNFNDVRVKTVSGDIDFENNILSRGVFNVTSGDIWIESKIAKNIGLEVESMSGDVRLNLRGSVSADFLVGTFSGDIHILGIPKRNKDNEYEDFTFMGKNKSMKFNTGTDGGRISIQSFSGDISVVKKL